MSAAPLPAPTPARGPLAGPGLTRAPRSVAFRREREATWRALEDLIAAADRGGVRALTSDQLARLPHLYRATLSSLSVARSISLDQALTAYLENLCGRAYFVVYGARQPLARQLATILGEVVPRTLRAARWHLALAAAAMVIAAIAAFVLTRRDLDYYYAFVGDMAQDRTPASSTEALRAGLYDHGGATDALATFAAGLFSHNARIGIVAFATGFVAGLPTLALLFVNGLTLGGFVALYHTRGLGLDVWGWLLPHGITELGAVVICGAGGLQLAHALVFPGARPRLDALRERGRAAAVLVATAIAMLFLAGLIEGVFRQQVTSVPIRYAVAAATAVGWAGYFGFVGRRGERAERAR